MGLFGLFGKKVIMQCNCGCGCRETFEKYGRRMDTYMTLALETRTKWKCDYEICMDCNADRHTKSTDNTRPKDRKHFSSETISETWKIQGGRCNNEECRKRIGTVNGKSVGFDYDHIDGDPSNNHPSNCQALCLDCHREKTNREKRKA